MYLLFLYVPCGQTDLDLSPYLGADADPGLRSTSAYALSAVVEHHGRGVSEGHYTAYGRNEGGYSCSAHPPVGTPKLLPFPSLTLTPSPGSPLPLPCTCTCVSPAQSCMHVSPLYLGTADVWMLFNDHRVSVVTKEDVQGCQGAHQSRFLGWA
jgi:hypothetical protein